MRDILITVIVFGGLAYTFNRPSIGVLLWSWIGYMNPHRLSYGFAYSFPFAAVVAVVTIIGLFMGKEKLQMHWTPVTITLIFFILWMCLTTAMALVPETANPEWVRMVKIQLVIFITLLLMNDRKKIDQLIWVIVGSIGYYGVKGGIFTLLTGGNFRIWGPEGSFIEGNNEVALAFVMTVPLMRYLQLQATNKYVRYGLSFSMAMMAFSILASYSRGALLAGGVMALFFVLKSRKKFLIGGLMIVLVPLTVMFMPDQWFDRMGTIENYEEDESAMGRINAWYFAFNVAVDKPLIGGGYGVFDPDLFYIYSENPEDFHDAHSIYFEVLGEQGFVGLILFLMVFIFAFQAARWVNIKSKGRQDLQWTRDLTSMLTVSLIGYAVGGAFLGLAYFDLPYHLVALIVIARALVEKELLNKNHEGIDQKPNLPVVRDNNSQSRKSKYEY